MMKNEWIGVDLDGTLAMYDESAPYESTRIGDPVWPMVDRVLAEINRGEEVRIFTARADDKDAERAMRDFLIMAGLPEDLKITNKKDQWCREIWDDRARQVLRNTGEFALPYDGEDRRQPMAGIETTIQKPI